MSGGGAKAMKRWRIETRVIVTAYTYVWAENREHAIEKLENQDHEPDLGNPIDYESEGMDRDSLEAIGECQHTGLSRNGRCFRCGAGIRGKG